MKKSQSFVNARRNKILEYMKSTGVVKVEDIAALFKISNLTARRDFDALVQDGKIERFYGGAILAEDASQASDAKLKKLGNKHAIAKKAAEMVNDFETIFINSSSTALLVLKYITAKYITIITNNGKALFASRPKDSTLIFTGGEIRVPKNAMVGDFATNNIMKVTANKCFMGCAGISLSLGIMSTVLQEAAINEMMISHTNGDRVILADYSRFERIQPFQACSIECITHLITDVDAPDSVLESYRKKGIKVYPVKPLKKFLHDEPV
jgi:DeoR/GlpR family transcriptional regulator of sugar metabolism